MNGRERLDSLKRQIESSRKVSVLELSETFHVTEETIRRDLDKLEQEGIVTRTHGGVVWNADPLGGGVHFSRRKMKNQEAKRDIAGKVFSLIENRKTIAADSSTTVLESLRMLSSKSELMVLTNSAVVSQELADASFSILASGGIFNPRSLSYQGTLAKENLKRYNVELALISCKGLMIDQGVMDSYETEAEIKKVMLKQAREVALLADHTKFNQMAFVHLADLNQINYLVTDRRPDERWIAYCAEHGISLIF